MLPKELRAIMEEKTQYSEIEITIHRLQEEDSEELSSFSCGCEELDSFFHEEVFLCSKYRYITAYCAKELGTDRIVAVFTLANDAVVLDSSDDKEDLVLESIDGIPEEYLGTFKQQTSFPAINIGHLGVLDKMQGRHIGQQIIDFIIGTLVSYDAAGCQYITVDSLNNAKTNHFYMSNGFVCQTMNDMYRPTRRMFLSIIPFLMNENQEDE